MSVFLEVLKELGSMFFGAPRMAIPILIVIALAAAIAHFASAQGAGAFLLIGCLTILAENVFHEARRAKR